MTKVKILVVEDEILIADNICDTLEEFGYDALEPAINYTEALATLKEDAPDIAILDINLSGNKTGIDVAKIIKEKYDIPFIFLTSNSDHKMVEEVKLVNPNAFLVKPFVKDELYSAIEIAIYNFDKEEVSSLENQVVKKSFFIKVTGGFEKVLFSEITDIISDHVYIEIILKNLKRLVVRTSLGDILNKLPPNFIRIHRGHIVNVDFISEINKNSIKIKEKIIPIGKNYKNDFLAKMNIL